MNKDWSNPVPQKVEDVDIAFPGNVHHLMPPMEFLNNLPYNNKWRQIFKDWFYFGLQDLKLKPKSGIDENDAFRHISVIVGSWEPKHEHKEAAVAYLMEKWFKYMKYTKGEINYL